MWKIDDALSKILGITPAFIRPPYGSYNDLALQAAAFRGQTVVTWDFDSQDSAGASADTSKGLYSQVVEKHPDTILSLNHETSDTTVHQVLAFAIQKLQSAGYKLVSVADCLGQAPYLNTQPPGERDSCVLFQLMIYGQKFLVYPLAYDDRPRQVPEPSALGLPFEDLRLTTPDKVTLACHLMLFSDFYSKLSSPPESEKRLSCMDTGSSSRRASAYSSIGSKMGTKGKERAEEAELVAAGRATIIMFHGNAMTHGDVIDLAAQFLNMGCNVLTVSYRGYGHSTGRPSESGLRIDAQTALDYLTQHPILCQVPIIVFGQSLGGAVAIDLVSRNTTEVSALILENTFMSIPALVRDWPSPIGPLSFLCTQRWPSINRICKISKDVPILMLSGDKDMVVPPKHMRGLWVAARSRGNEQEDDGATCSPFLSFLCKPGRRSKPDVVIDVEAPGGAQADEDEDDLSKLESPASIWNGGDLFQYIAGTGHENTCLDESYWVAIRTFIDRLRLPLIRTYSNQGSST
ncbi:hypothetical protein H1R20_g8388, partial [Candolleomyces eurysporus]